MLQEGKSLSKGRRARTKERRDLVGLRRALGRPCSMDVHLCAVTGGAKPVVAPLRPACKEAGGSLRQILWLGPIRHLEQTGPAGTSGTGRTLQIGYVQLLLRWIIFTRAWLGAANALVHRRFSWSAFSVRTALFAARGYAAIYRPRHLRHKQGHSVCITLGAVPEFGSSSAMTHESKVWPSGLDPPFGRLLWAARSAAACPGCPWGGAAWHGDSAPLPRWWSAPAAPFFLHPAWSSDADAADVEALAAVAVAIATPPNYFYITNTTISLSLSCITRVAPHCVNTLMILHSLCLSLSLTTRCRRSADGLSPRAVLRVSAG